MNSSLITSKYNISESLFEIIKDKQKCDLIIKDIKSDKGYVNIEVLQFIYDTDYYPVLENKLKSKRQVLEKTNDAKKRIQLNLKIDKIEKEIKMYKINILMTSSFLVSIKRNDTIDKIKTLFFKGEISKALKLLDDKNLQVPSVVSIEVKRNKEKLERLYIKLVDNAFEFLTKGQLSSLNLNIESSENRFQKAKYYFEKGILSIEKSTKIVHEAKYKLIYSNFLRNHNQFSEVGSLIKRGLEINRSLALNDKKNFLPNIALILHGQAIYQNDINEIEKAEKSFDEAIEIRKSLSNDNSEESKSQLANLLDNYATFLTKKNDFDKAYKTYHEALVLRRELVKKKPLAHLSSLATTINGLGIISRERNELIIAENYYLECLTIRSKISKNEEYLIAEVKNNLGILYCDKKDFTKALKMFSDTSIIFKKLSKNNPKQYLPKQGEALNNLAILYRNTNNTIKAEDSFKKALKIFRQLSIDNPKKFVPYLAGTLLNFSRFYQKLKIDKKLSLELLDEMISILFPFRHIPYIQNYINEACKTINNWGVDYRKYITKK